MEREVLKAFNRKPVDIPILNVTGGKGGTGKTTIAVNLAATLGAKGYRVLLVDTDVDSPTTSTVLGVQPIPKKEVNLFIPQIIEEKCAKCGRCEQVCRSHAIIQISKRYPMFFKELCSGCEACILSCPSGAIERGSKIIGRIYSALESNVSFIGGELKPSEAQTAHVVAATKEFTFRELRKKSYHMMIVDSPPGTHCNVVQSLRGADLALAVTEPTPLGIYDLNLILKLTSRLGIRTEVVLNKADLPGHEKEGVLAMARHLGTRVISEVPFDQKLFQSYVDGRPVVVAYPESAATAAITKLAESVLDSIKEIEVYPRHPSTTTPRSQCD